MDYKWVVLAAISFGLLIVCVFYKSIEITILKFTPDLEYEKLINDKENAQKQLEHFYIDHPEFKKEVEE